MMAANAGVGHLHLESQIVRFKLRTRPVATPQAWRSLNDHTGWLVEAFYGTQVRRLVSAMLL